jgi:RNA polymerase sigma factor (sigma-70 family)
MQDREVLDAEFNKYVGLVGEFVRKATVRGLPTAGADDDLKSAGVLALWEGLNRATRKDDPERLLRYVFQCISGAIQDELRRLERSRRNYVEGRTVRVLSTEDLNVADVDRYFNLRSEEEVFDGSDDLLQLEKVRTALETLPTNWSRVLKLYYFDRLPVTEIAPMLGVSTVRVNQIRHQGLGRLRETLVDSIPTKPVTPARRIDGSLQTSQAEAPAPRMPHVQTAQG